MSHQIIPKGDGRYAVWSSVVDDFIWSDITARQLLTYYVGKAATEEHERVTKLLAEIDAGENPYAQFRMTYEEACDRARAGRVEG